MSFLEGCALAFPPILDEKYELLQELADDGLEATFYVRHRLLGETCLLKARPHQLSEDADAQARFDQRLPWFTRLKHPYLAQVYDVSIIGSLAIMEMERVEGASLEDVISKAAQQQTGATLPLSMGLSLADQSLDVLGYLHDQEWIHGTLSPAKFLLRRGSEQRVHLQLVDPGFGQLIGAIERTTAGGLLMRRLRYSAPEMFLGDDTIPTIATDLYALGLLLYELFTGRYPIVGESPTSLAAGHLLRSPLSFRQTDPQGKIPDGLRRLILRCLAKEPTERFTSAHEMRHALAEIERPDTVATEQQVMALFLSEQPTTGPNDPLGGQETGGKGTSGQGASGQGADSPEVVGQETVKISNADRRTRAREMLDSAREAVARSSYTEARNYLLQGLQWAPSDPQLAGVLQQVEQATRRRQIEARRQSALEEAALTVETLIERGDLRSARARLADAGQKFGPQDRLRALHQRLEQLAEEQPDSGREQQADDLVVKARVLSQSENFDEARAALQQAVELVPDHHAAHTLSDSVEALHALQQNEGRRQKGLDQTSQQIRQHLEQGQPGEAMATLQRAVARFGDRPDLQELRYEIAQAFLADDPDESYLDLPTPRTELRPATPQVPPATVPPAAAPAQAPPLSAAPAAAPSATPAAEPQLSDLADLSLRGMGAQEPVSAEPPAAAQAAQPPYPEPPSASRPWLDLRNPKDVILIVVLMILAVVAGYWLAQSGPAPAEESGPSLETEDVDGPKF